MLRLRALTVVIVPLGIASIAAANVTNAVTPSFRGAPCTRFAGWETFTNASALPNAPDVAGTTTTTAALTQLVAGAILTSTGNIYHPSLPTRFELTETAQADVQEVVVQLSTFGNPLDYASITLGYVDALGTPLVRAPDDFQLLFQGGGHEEVYARWDLSALADDVDAYTVRFNASASNMSFDAALLDVRESCDPGSVFCSGDNSGTLCPCGNAGAAGNGCANSVNALGAHLAGSGAASIGADTFVLASSGTPNATCLFFQGSLAENAGLGVVLGDGLRCVGGTILRLGSSIASGGVAQYPAGSQAAISVRGGISAPGTSAVYQTWYRNAAAGFCPPATFNLTNGYAVVWRP